MKATVKICEETAKGSGIFLLKLLLKEPMKIEPGQFITLKPLNTFSVMFRPFSVCSVSETGDQILILFKVVGKNTEAYSKLRTNDQVEISDPKGNPIPLNPDVKNYILVGGGIGAAALIFLAEELRNSGKSVKILLGANQPNQLINAKVFEVLKKGVETITDTGGEHNGKVTSLLAKALENDQGKSTIIACGPVVMLQKITAMTAKSENKCLVLLEEIMACGGVGSCKGCAVFGEDGTVKYVCQDGPAFDASWIDWERIMRRYEITPILKSGGTPLCQGSEGQATNPLKTILTGQGGKTLEVATPIMNASGCLDFEAIKRGQVSVNHAGALITKGVTPGKRTGNESPRVCEVAGGMLNSIGLANKGIIRFLGEDLHKWLDFGLPVIVNIAGSAIDEYDKIARLLANTGIKGIEINVSCPNVKHGGMAFGTDPEQTFKIVEAVREAAPNIFLIVKLTPAAGTHIVDVAEEAVKAGADALSLINTVPGLAFDIYSRRATLGVGGGGYSGPGILPIAIRMIRDVYETNLGVPIIGVGGIHDGASAMQAILAGASAIQVGTGSFKNSDIISEIYYSFKSMIEYQGVNHIRDLVGQGVM